MSSPFVLKPCDANFTQAIKYLDVISNSDDYEGKAIPKAQKPLCGLGLAVKDLFHIQGLPTSAGNPDWLATHSIPENTSSCVAKMLQAGAVFKGKTITDELA